MDAPGGTGRTFLINLNYVQSEGKIALATATASSWITGGRYAGHDIIILCITLIPELPFEFRWLQFPVALCLQTSQIFKAVYM